MATLKDIAEHVGISVSAVSMALKDHRSISDETKRKVWEAQHVLGYKLPPRRPASLSDDLPPAPSDHEPATRDIVCLLIDRSFSTPAYGLFFQQLAETAIARLWRPIYLSATLEDLRQGKLPPLLNTGDIDGLVISGTYDAQAHRHIARLGIPLITIGCYQLGVEPWMSCEPDFGHGVRLLLDRLTSFGHQRIGLIQETAVSDYAFQVKRHFRLETEDMGIDALPPLTLPQDPEGAEHSLKAFLAQKPTAILCGTAMQKVYTACERLGLRIPEDISIVGFGPSSKYPASPPPAYVTSCHSFIPLAIEKLARLIKDPQTTRSRELVPMRLEPGASIGPAPAP